MIDWTPDPIALSIGPLTIYWYGVMYAIGLAATFVVVEREARRRGLDTGVLVNGIIIIAVAALIGGRLYHVIDQWDRYKDDLLSIVLPPYSGLGVYGGILTGFAAGMLYARWKRQPVLAWTDVAAPGLLTMQAVARWGNFFNQELYGPPTNLPWGIAIECANRTATWACPPLGTTPVDAHFHPLFLYESLSGALGAIILLLLARRVRSLRPGDLTLLFFVWYGTTRFLLEPLRTNNWTVGGVAVASIISATFVLAALAVLAWRHRPGARATAAAAAGPDAGSREVPPDVPPPDAAPPP
ncbi:MAG TPA: prolipoprotein diacylglyceryl transferase [Candidatus Nanopelagicales bacterium]|nr:prolipoprotein diacylglyceryl transferase [Candidatus Nanopelagicales bacterium]